MTEILDSVDFSKLKINFLKACPVFVLGGPGNWGTLLRWSH